METEENHSGSPGRLSWDLFFGWRRSGVWTGLGFLLCLLLLELVVLICFTDDGYHSAPQWWDLPSASLLPWTSYLPKFLFLFLLPDWSCCAQLRADGKERGGSSPPINPIESPS